MGYLIIEDIESGNDASNLEAFDLSYPSNLLTYSIIDELGPIAGI